MNNLALSVAMGTAPSSAFSELRERPRFWFPLLLLIASTVAIVYWYYSMVDIEWLKDAMFSNDPDMQKLPEAERAAAMAMFGRNTLLWSSVIGAVFVLPIFFLLQALYLLLAAKVTKLPQGFKHWFATTSRS
jgi:Yip1 domain